MALSKDEVVHFSIRPIAKFLARLVIIFTILHVTVLVLDNVYNNRVTELLVEKFSFDLERNFPTYFSALLLFSSSILFLLISFASKIEPNSIDHKYWLGLGLIFLFLSVDEAAHIHEHFDSDFIWGAHESIGLLAWPWVIVYGILVGFFVLTYFRFWRQLPGTFKWSYMLAGCIYVGSALGFEMLEAQEYSTNQSTYTPTYYVFTSIEEFFEMSAIAFLVYTNIRYLVVVFPRTSFSFSESKVDTLSQEY